MLKYIKWWVTWNYVYSPLLITEAFQRASQKKDILGLITLDQRYRLNMKLNPSILL